MTKLSLIIPCYNEEKGIDNLSLKLTPVLKELEQKYDLELIFVDDGSKDNTAVLLQEKFGSLNYLKLVKHEVNKNLGEAIKTGFKTASGDLIVTLDSDCTYDVNKIPDLLNLLDDETSIVTASPYHPQGGILNVPYYRLFLSKSISFIYRFLTGAKIYTFTALFRAYKKEVVKSVDFKSANFLATAEFLISALQKGYKVKEYPLVLNVREFGESKMKLFQVIKSHFKFAGGLFLKKIF